MAEGTTAGVYSHLRYDFWDGGPLMGPSGVCQAPDAVVDNNDCETSVSAFNSADIGSGSVVTPDATTSFTYSDEGEVLDRHQLLPAGVNGIPAAGAALDTTYGDRKSVV